MSKKFSAIAVVALLMLATAQMAMATEAVVTGNVQVQACPVGTVGIGLSENILNFGPVTPGLTSSKPLDITITANGYVPGACDDLIEEPNPSIAPTEVDVDVQLGDWLNSGNVAESLIATLHDVPEIMDVPSSDTFTFTVSPAVGTPADTYTQTITITATY